VDVVLPGLKRDPGAPAGHVEGIGDADDSRLDRERRPIGPVADDGVHRLGADDRSLRLLVDGLKQPVDHVGRQEQAIALVVSPMDRHPDAVQQAGRSHNHLCVSFGEGEVGDNAGGHSSAKQQARQAQADVEHDLDMDPGVVRHPKPAGRVDRRDVPESLDMIVRVDRVEQCLQAAVATRRSPHPDISEGFPRGERRLAGAGVSLWGKFALAHGPRR
jgi:hypothetical protein